ncbi:hypothetical protein ABZ131_20955 [Providencia rettgeri]
MENWYYILGFVLFVYCAYSSNPAKFIILKSIRNITFLVLAGLLIFVFSIGGGNNLSEAYAWYEKYYDFYDWLIQKTGVQKWIFWTAWIAIPISYFSIRLAMVRDVVIALRDEKLLDSKAMNTNHTVMVVSSAIGIAFFIPAFESISKLIIYISLSYEKIRLVGNFSKPEIDMVSIIVGIVALVIFKIYFNKAFLLNSKYI